MNTGRQRLISVTMLFILTQASAWGAGIPLMIPHSGTVRDSLGTPLNVEGQFKFAIINGHADCVAATPSNCRTFWSNDGTSVDGSMPIASVTLTVANGVFSLKLGDVATLANMTAIPSAVFGNPETFLRIWFDGELLVPDRQLVSVPYAYRAEIADSVVSLGASGTINDPANPIDWTQLKSVPPGFADNLDDTGITSESDPTVAVSVKDGVSWAELAGIPADFADGVDNTGGTPSDLICTSPCVDSTEIIDGTVTTGDLAFDAATQSELNVLGTTGTLNSATNPMDWTQLKSVPPGFADGVDDTGLTAETDPTVLASVKDGVSWSELAGIPIGFADGVDDSGLTSETDPTVLASVKDGVSWSKLAGKPAGFADGIDNTGLTSETDPKAVKLQGATPGTANTGHLNITGTGIFGGFVGIGTTSPNNLLDLGSGGGRKLAVFQNNAGTDFYGLGISTDRLEFHAGNNGTGNPKMVLRKSTGNIGIGTTTPRRSLDVNGEIVATSRLTLAQDGGVISKTWPLSYF